MSMEEKKLKMEEVKCEDVVQVETVKFLVWFTTTLDKNSKVKPNHMSSIKAYFGNIGLGEAERSEDYDEGLKQFGF